MSGGNREWEGAMPERIMPSMILVSVTEVERIVGRKLTIKDVDDGVSLVAPPPPAPEVEPVAWTGRGCGVITDKAKVRMIEEGKYGGEFAIAAKTAERHDIPLYTHPANDGLRKAAQAVVDGHVTGTAGGYYALVKNLRDTLNNG